MRKLPLIATIAFAVLVWVATSCGSSSENTQSEVDQKLDEKTEEKAPISAEIVRDLLSSIPSPVETSMLIEESGGKYNREILNPTENANSYNTNVKRAFNLGIYGTDLGFTNIYGKTQDGINYLDAVQKMAEGLSIGQFFDFNTIKRLAGNSSNVDSLLMITNDNFQKINAYLQEHNRSKFSLLIITGGWLEGVHLMGNVYKQGKSEALKEKIGEQKIILDHLAVLLEFYKDDPQIGEYATELLKLKEIYEEVKITKEYLEPVMETIDGIPVLVEKSTTTVFITDEQLDKIFNQVQVLRNKIIES